ncbi:MAG: hypothetical protein MI725_08180 [Pirellulales bacterium]|nr:hypothetical protein [Pirellulales bacterium]
MSFDATTRIEFDPLGDFSSFHSKISLNDHTSVLRLSGRVKDSCLELKVRTGTILHSTPIYLSDSKALKEALIPSARIPNLKEGSCWQEEVYSPFSAPGDPVELVRAEVVGKEQMEFEEDVCWVLKVEYRGITSVGVPDKARLLAVAWVDLTKGYVLRRDVYVGTSKLRFERVSQHEAEEIGAQLFDEIFRYGNSFSPNKGVDEQQPQAQRSKPLRMI